MNINRFIYFFLLAVSILSGACNRKAVPGLGSAKSGESYDEAAYNYYYGDAVRYKLLGNSGEALKYFEHCFKINPESDASLYQMAQIVINNGDLGTGKKNISQAIDLQPKNLWYLLTLAGIYYQEGNIDSAVLCYEKAVSYYPDRENLLVSLGNLYSENKDLDKARMLFSKIDEKAGINEKTTVPLIRVLLEETKYKEAQVKVLELLKENPDDILYNGLLAETYRGEGDKEKAFSVYNQLIERNPDNPQIQLSLLDFLLKEKNYEELFGLMNTVILNNKISREEKISVIAGLIENDELVEKFGSNLGIVIMVLEANYRNDNLVLLLRPELLQKSKRLADAAERLEEIIVQYPDNYYAWEKLLLIYYDLKDFDNLFIRGEQCATRFNRSFLAKVLYANAAIEKENYTVALEELRKAAILAGENKEMNLQVLVMKADVYYRMKDYLKSFETFDEAIKYNSDDMTVLNNYAYYLAEQEIRLKEADEMIRKVIEKEKDNTTFLDTYAWVLYKRGKTKEAARIMEAIINSGEDEDAEWFEHYGYILKKMGKCKEAIGSWQTAIRLDPSKKEILKEIEACKRK